MPRLLLLAGVMLLLSGCASTTRFSDANATGYRQLEREECVPYARRVSGINLRGDAWTWWNSAAGTYARGNRPAPGAMLVLSRTNRLRSGHLAVVRNTLGPRDIMVTHTNWGDDMISRRIVYESMRAQDVSPANNWTSIRFWNREIGNFGSPYAAHGFIYNAPDYAPAVPTGPMTAPLPQVSPVYHPAPVIQTPPRPIQQKPVQTKTGPVNTGPGFVF